MNVTTVKLEDDGNVDGNGTVNDLSADMIDAVVNSAAFNEVD